MRTAASNGARGRGPVPPAQGPPAGAPPEPAGPTAAPRGAAGAESPDDRVFREQARFRRLLRRFLRFSERAAREEGITPEQHQLLLAIRGSRRGWLLVGQVAAHLMIVPHGAASLVERAAAHDLVRKEADPHDGRRVRVLLTPRGEAVVTRLTALHRARLRRLWARIPPPA